MRCPECRDEFRADVSWCSECGVELIGEDVALPARVDALLGTFHPVAAELVTALLDRRGIAFDALPAPEDAPVRAEVHTATDAVEVVVDRDFRDDVRAELAVNWSGLVGRLGQEQLGDVLAAGGRQPGWYDAPAGAWVDKHGRLQVDPAADEEREADAARTVGPTLVVLGTVLGLFGWYADASAALVLLGLGAAVIGLLLPR